MTHAELLAKLDAMRTECDGTGEYSACGDLSDQAERFVLAFRTLLAIHRPSADHGDGYHPYCIGCWEAGGQDGAPSWPCPTVETIAAAL